MTKGLKIKRFIFDTLNGRYIYRAYTLANAIEKVKKDFKDYKYIGYQESITGKIKK